MQIAQKEVAVERRSLGVSSCQDAILDPFSGKTSVSQDARQHNLLQFDHHCRLTILQVSGKSCLQRCQGLHAQPNFWKQKSPNTHPHQWSSCQWVDQQNLSQKMSLEWHLPKLQYAAIIWTMSKSQALAWHLGNLTEKFSFLCFFSLFPTLPRSALKLDIIVLKR